MRDVLRDTRDHETALAAGMKAGLDSVLGQLSPANVADQFEQGRARQLAPGQDPRPGTGNMIPSSTAGSPSRPPAATTCRGRSRRRSSSSTRACVGTCGRNARPDDRRQQLPLERQFHDQPRRPHQQPREPSRGTLAPRGRQAAYIRRRIPAVELLNDEAVEIIEANAETILEEIGIEFRRDPESLRLWREAGADVQGERVRIPRGLARQLLRTAPREFTLHAEIRRAAYAWAVTPRCFHRSAVRRS